MEILLTSEGLISLLTLTTLEIVLGIDNIIFLAILVARLPKQQQPFARRVGLLLAMGTRILLLLTLSWIMGLKVELFRVLGHSVSGRDLILLLGGLFLIGKATFEIHDKLEGPEEADHPAGRGRVLWMVLVQIAVIDIVFSLDSVITAVGMARHVSIMIGAVVMAVIVMMFFAGPVGDFVNRHPTMKILALSFLLLIGVLLVADGCGMHVDKGYIYFAMAFSVFVESLNMRFRRKHSAVTLRGNLTPEVALATGQAGQPSDTDGHRP